MCPLASNRRRRIDVSLRVQTCPSGVQTRPFGVGTPSGVRTRPLVVDPCIYISEINGITISSFISSSLFSFHLTISTYILTASERVRDAVGAVLAPEQINTGIDLARATHNTPRRALGFMSGEKVKTRNPSVYIHV